MFVNFLMATNVFDMPASLFARYLEFFDIETATPMQTWSGGTRRMYEALSADFRDRIHLGRPVRKVYIAARPRSWWRTRTATPRPSTTWSSRATRTRR